MLSPGQQGRYRPLVAQAWLKTCQRELWPPSDRARQNTWYRQQLVAALGIYSTTQAGNTGDFEVLMAHFEAIAGGSLYWQLRLANGDKRRLLFHLRRMLRRIPADDAYLQAIADQMGLGDVDDLPPADLRRLLIALDEHLKRQAAAYNQAPATHRRAS